MGYWLRKKVYSREATEKEIEKSILEYLATLPDAFFWKVNNVGVYDVAGGFYRMPKSRFILRGQADIQGLFKGKYVAIEVKRKQTRGNTSIYQKQFLENVNNFGGIAFVACSVEDVKEKFKDNLA